MTVDRPVDRQFEHEAIKAHQRDADRAADRDGLLDPDQPTKSATDDYRQRITR